MIFGKNLLIHLKLNLIQFLINVMLIKVVIYFLLYHVLDKVPPLINVCPFQLCGLHFGLQNCIVHFLVMTFVILHFKIREFTW
jgi:hypothetical protein